MLFWRCLDLRAYVWKYLNIVFVVLESVENEQIKIKILAMPQSFGDFWRLYKFDNSKFHFELLCIFLDPSFLLKKLQ